MKLIGLFSLLGACLVSFADDTPPEFLKYTAGCFEANSHFREDGKEATLGNFRDWIVLIQDGKAWLEKHVDADSGDSHFGFKWEKLDNGQWKMSQYSPHAPGKSIYECTSPITEVELKPTKEKIFVRRCEANGAPLPARERRNKRKDYETLNRIHVTRFSKTAVSDVQRNTKVKADKSPLSTEEGWVEYVRLDDAECKNRPNK